ncbi:ester cyclase [Streptomyces kunmingensis]|uniref:Ester cyclase n=1 Tax=Streptomyces kunmingensis TaxID=68225 RepID=A0ABU6C4H0_9ACTN|nr:ester cyclase [Streptomyces kunmingensis]MEB3959624.1 ester cyclase [Streptomyces kunmingensis]
MRPTGLPAQLYAAYNRHDPTAAGHLYGAHATHDEIAQGGSRQGPEAIAEGLRHFFHWFPDAYGEPLTQIADPSGRVAVTYRLTATLHEPMGAIAARHQPLSLRGVHVLHLARNEIRGSEDYWDVATFHRQMKNTGTGETS